MAVLLAQISDLHLDGTERATRRATRVMEHLRALPRPVDALGDIADHGEPAEYEEAARMLAASFPVLTCPGNHDARPAYRTALLGEGTADGPVNRVHRIAGTAVLMCDSSVPGRHEGCLDAETLGWIDATLTALPPDTPVLIAFHHPPVVVHQPFLDSIRLEQPERPAALLDAHPEVVAVLTGHAHTAASTFAGHRNGASGLNNPNTTDINNYKAAVYWIQTQINSNSANLTNDTRFWVQVPAI